tara:strand:+ start:153 stop:335 length:183 start_codon:yes stop_codon:yes gene_type:complete
MKVPQHQITNSTLRTVASEELQEEVEKELQTAKASKKPTPSLSKLLATSNKEEEDEEDGI